MLHTPQYKFIPVQSAWHCPKLEAIAADVEIDMDRVSRRYVGRDMPFDVQERFDNLSAFWDSLCDADKAARDAEWGQ